MVDVDEVRARFYAALRGGGEAERARLVELVYEDVDAVLRAVSGVVGGDTVPDTVAAMRAAEVVVAALAAGASGRLRLLIPRDPVPGWAPLRSLAELLASRGLAVVYTVPMQPSSRVAAREVARRAGRVARGISARVVDVTDASPPVVAGLYGGGVRYLTVLVDAGYMAVFQRFTYT